MHCLFSTIILSVAFVWLAMPMDAVAQVNASSQKNRHQQRHETAIKQAQQQLDGAGDSASSGAWVRLGDAQLRAGNCAEAVTAFEKAIQLEPRSEPYLWQHGIALFFVRRYADGQALFEKHRRVNPNDVENAAWHFLCVAKANDIQQARRLLLPAPNDPRPPMEEILKRLGSQDDTPILNRMRSLKATSAAGSAEFYGNLYLGLIADAESKSEKAKRYMSVAAKTEFTHYMADVARVYDEHLKSQARLGK